MTSNGQRFRRRSLRRGYKVDEVDEFLDRVEATLNGERVDPPVRSHEVHEVVFRVRFGGYDEWQVDLHLDRVERQLADQEGGAAPAERATADRMPERVSSERVPPHAERRQAPQAPLPTRSPMGSGIAAGGPGMGGPGAGGPGGPGQHGPGPGPHGPGATRAAQGPGGPGAHGMAGQRPVAPGGRQAYDEPTYAPPSNRPPVPPIAKAPVSLAPNAPQPPPGAKPGGPQPGGPQPGGPQPGGRPPAPGVYGAPQGPSGYDASRHGRMDMTTEMRMPDMRPGATSNPPPRGDRTPGIPTGAPPPSGPGGMRGGSSGPSGNGVASPGEVQRIDQIRRGFQARRFGSGYDRAEVDRLFEGVIAAMSGRSTMPVNETELDSSQFSLVPGGYFEDEVDQALREVRDIFRRR